MGVQSGFQNTKWLNYAIYFMHPLQSIGASIADNAPGSMRGSSGCGERDFCQMYDFLVPRAAENSVDRTHTGYIQH